MSDEPKQPYYQDFMLDHNQQIERSSTMYSEKQFSSSSYDNNSQAFDPSYMSFTDCLQGGMDYNSLATSFGLSPSTSEVFSSVDQGNHQKPAEAGDIGDGGAGGGGSEALATLNSSISSSSSEAGAEEDSGKRKKNGQVIKEEQGQETSKNG